jgi:hypothetical protein
VQIHGALLLRLADEHHALPMRVLGSQLRGNIIFALPFWTETIGI